MIQENNLQIYSVRNPIVFTIILAVQHLSYMKDFLYLSPQYIPSSRVSYVYEVAYNLVPMPCVIVQFRSLVRLLSVAVLFSWMFFLSLMFAWGLS
jgi:hypothetical protein